MAVHPLLMSYGLDWLTIIAAMLIALALSTVNPDYHFYDPKDLSISYPHREAKLSNFLFVFLSILLPILAIAVTCLFPQFAPRVRNPSLVHQQERQQHSSKLWQLNASLLGLGVSVATSTIIATGVKNLTGKPRPDFLALCQPEPYLSGTTPVSERWCKTPDRAEVNDGFRSFPSGWATIAFAGLWYLTLFLSTRFGVLPPRPRHYSHLRRSSFSHSPMQDLDDADEPLMSEHHAPEPRYASVTAAPFLILLALPYVPLGLAIFIAGTRYFDFRNHGVDVIAGAGVGALTAWFGYRLYHPPVCEGVGRGAWGPRSAGRPDQNVDGG